MMWFYSRPLSCSMLRTEIITNSATDWNINYLLAWLNFTRLHFHNRLQKNFRMWIWLKSRTQAHELQTSRKPRYKARLVIRVSYSQCPALVAVCTRNICAAWTRAFEWRHHLCEKIVWLRLLVKLWIAFEPDAAKTKTHIWKLSKANGWQRESNHIKNEQTSKHQKFFE